MSVSRINPALAMAILGAAAGSFGPSFAEQVRAPELRGASSAQADPARPNSQTQRSNGAKLRDLNFLRGRGGPRRRSFAGAPMSVAEGKRQARKLRNRQRHKKQWKKAVR